MSPRRTGAIDIGYQSSFGGQIGTWKVISTAAVPEPSTYALLVGVAGLGVGLMRRRKLVK